MESEVAEVTDTVLLLKHVVNDVTMAEHVDLYKQTACAAIREIEKLREALKVRVETLSAEAAVLERLRICEELHKRQEKCTSHNYYGCIARELEEGAL
jgi:hypothetical protein